MQATITAIAIYALKAALTLALLYTPYILFMRKETLFGTNRTTLLLALLLSFAIPCIDIPALHIDLPFVQEYESVAANITFEEPQRAILAEETTTAEVKSMTLGEAVYYFLSLPYIVITLVVAAKKIVELARIRRNIRRGTLWKEEKEEYTIYCHAGETAPYSWMKNIVISQEDYEKFGKEIILHEEGHIRHRHSWDMLLISAAESLQWFNPFVHMLATDLKDLHEFQADAYVLQRENNSKKYQMLIIKKAVGHASYTLANSFNHSKNLKKRITMMLKKKSNPVRCATALYILPAAALTLSLFASPQETVGNNLADDPVSVHKSSETFEKNDTTEERIYKVCEKLPEFPGGTKALLKFLGENTKYPEEARKNGKEGRAFIQFVISTDGSVCDVKVVKSAGDESLDNEAMRVIASMPKWEPGTQGGEKVRVQYTLPVAFHINKPQSEKSATENPVKNQVAIPKDAKKNDIIYEVCEKQPEFPGGAFALMKFLRDNIKYPEEARKDTIQGKAHIQFVVNTDGSICDIKVAKSAGNESLDKEAVRVVASMPKWEPGTQSGEKVRVRFVLPITYRLQ